MVRMMREGACLQDLVGSCRSQDKRSKTCKRDNSRRRIWMRHNLVGIRMTKV